MRKIFIVILILIFATTGCTFNTKTIYVESIDVFFPLDNGIKVNKEVRDIEYTDKQDLYKKIAQEFIKGPNSKTHSNISIDNSSKVSNVKIIEDKIVIDFTKRFFSEGYNEILVSAFVTTLTQLETVNYVKVLINGEELLSKSGVVYGFMDNSSFDLNKESREIVLYFGNSQATHVVAESRVISVDSNSSREEFFERILEELIKGPKSENLYKTIPKEVKILDVEIIGDILRVDFSSEMYTKHSHGAAGELMTVASIANTVTELEDITAVLPTVEGEPLSIEHMIITEPLKRYEEQIYR